MIATRNHRRLGVLNGTRGVVVGPDPASASLSMRTDDGKTVVLPGWYVDRHLAPGYATTIHKTQGATFDRCLVLVDDALYREAAYSALSRGRAANHLFVVVEDERVDERHLPEQSRQADRIVAGALRRSERELTATELVARHGQSRPYSPPLPPVPHVERGPSRGL